MSIHSLHFTGPDLGPCVLGQPMLAHYGETHIGTLDPVPVSRGGTEIRIEHFKPADSDASRRLHKAKIGRVLLPRLVAFIAEHFSSITLIQISLARDIGGYVEGFRLAAERTAVLQAMGAEGILITPKPATQHMGHFVVAGVWEYKQANLAALAATLDIEWAAFDERQAAAQGLTRKRRWFFARRPPGSGVRWPRR